MGYPTHAGLDSLTPENPVILFHASGHGLFANQAAMDAAKISSETPDPDGGKIIRDEFGRPTGVFEENAQYLIRKAYSDYLAKQGPEEIKNLGALGLMLHKANVLKKGLPVFKMQDRSIRILLGIARWPNKANWICVLGHVET